MDSTKSDTTNRSRRSFRVFIIVSVAILLITSLAGGLIFHFRAGHKGPTVQGIPTHSPSTPRPSQSVVAFGAATISLSSLRIALVVGSTIFILLIALGCLILLLSHKKSKPPVRLIEIEEQPEQESNSLFSAIFIVVIGVVFIVVVGVTIKKFRSKNAETSVVGNLDQARQVGNLGQAPPVEPANVGNEQTRREQERVAKEKAEIDTLDAYFVEYITAISGVDPIRNPTHKLKYSGISPLLGGEVCLDECNLTVLSACKQINTDRTCPQSILVPLDIIILPSLDIGIDRDRGNEQYVKLPCHLFMTTASIERKDKIEWMDKLKSAQLDDDLIIPISFDPITNFFVQKSDELAEKFRKLLN